MRDIVRAYIEKYQLLTLDRPVLVGVSGGADSIALLTLLVELGYSCIAAHCNFHLRGEESMRDEAFVKRYVNQLGVPLLQVDFETQLYATTHHLSIEMAARELRYEWFEKQRQAVGAQAIAVAHHRDDSVETVLMNLVRGTGIRGLSGIRPKNGYVVRPLLGVGRDDLIIWLRQRNLPFVIDSSNLSDAYTRNFIRLRVIPLLEQLNPSLKQAMARTSEHLSAAEGIYTAVVEKAKQQVFESKERLSIEALMSFPSPDAILYELLRDYQFSRPVVDAIFLSLTKESGKVFYSPTYRLVKDRAYLLLVPIELKTEFVQYTIPEGVTKWFAPIELSFQEMALSKEFIILNQKQIAYFDRDKLIFPLTLRHWKLGDWFVPFGMKGRKKLSDYFSDRKFSRLEKEAVWLLCSGEDIIWIIGERSDNRFRVDERTKRVFVVNFSA